MNKTRCALSNQLIKYHSLDLARHYDIMTLEWRPGHPKCHCSIMADDYVDRVLAEHNRRASSTASSKSLFVAIGAQMWRIIWRIVIRFMQGYHRQPTAQALFQVMTNSALETFSWGYDEAPFKYGRTVRARVGRNGGSSLFASVRAGACLR
jgi:hypothetical protein